MDFVGAIKSGFRNYAVFQGRASRSEFWWWMLFAILANIVASILDAVFFGMGPGHFGVFGPITSLALLLPGLSVLVRRLHDTDHSGWWYWLVLTIIGIIPLFVWFCTKGQPISNRYGLPPT
jgi:uncharacterized membrane protein YhaH (DUF805 family)